MTHERKGHLTSLLSVGSSFLEYAVKTLGVTDMDDWVEFERGGSAMTYHH
jgi:hypothetical protein